jgi:hypothetical protein
MNTYKKYTANVFVAKCEEQHEKGAIIEMSTKYGQTHEAIVFNLVFRDKEGFYYYSIVRADGYNIQERAKAKAERYQNWANSREEKAAKYYQASQEGKDFLVMAEPIKVGHHSEKRHRALIDRNWNRMGKSVEFSNKAAEYESRAEYWARKANDINLSMPESLEFYEYKLEESKMLHEGLKSGEIKRDHQYSLTYAKKDVKKFEELFKYAKKLWE